MKDDKSRYTLRVAPELLVKLAYEERSDAAISCRNYQVRISLFVCTVCRFAVLGDMSPPHIGGFVCCGAS